MVKRYEHRHGGMMPVNREVDTYVSSSDYAKLETERDELQDEHARICLDWMSICGTQKKEIKELTAERDRLRKALERGRLAIGEHSAPEECYATGPLTGCAIQDLIVCPACAFIDAYDDINRTALVKVE